MKFGSWILSVVAAGAVSVWAAEEGGGKPEAYYITKTMGIDRKFETAMMSESDFKALEKTLKLEQKLFSKALSLAAKEWRADETYKGQMFPATMLKPRSIVASQKFASSVKAEEQMAKLENQAARKAEREAEKEEAANRGRSGKKAPKRESKRDEILADAAIMVMNKLQELMAGAGEAPAGGGAGAGEAPAAKVEGGGAQLGVGAEGAKALKKTL